MIKHLGLVDRVDRAKGGVIGIVFRGWRTLTDNVLPSSEWSAASVCAAGTQYRRAPSSIP
jgi:hypothetical protein